MIRPLLSRIALMVTRPLRRLRNSVMPLAEGPFTAPLPTDLETSVQRRTAALTLSEARLVQAQELAQSGSWEWDVVSGAVVWSDESFRIFGFAPGGCTPSYEQYLACIHPDDRPPTAAWIASVLEQKTTARLDNRIIRPDGEVRFMHGRADVVLDDSGRVVRVFGTVQDITERKKHEDQLHLFRSLLDQSTDSILITNPATAQIVDASGSACASLGYTREELLALRVPDVETAIGSIEAFEQNLQRLKAAGALRFEGRQRRKDGSTIPVEVSVCYVARPEGDYVLTIARDISERMRFEADLRQAKDAADAASRAKSEFLATISHEIRTPVNGVIGAIGLLLDGELTSRHHELATIVRSSAATLLALINDILDISKIEAGKTAIEQAPLDLLAILEGVCGLFAVPAEEKRLELVLRYAPGARRWFVGDASRIRQVLMNLVGNAIKFSERGHVLVSVEEEPGGERDSLARLRFTVEDTGIGISPEAATHVFERFTQADTSTTRRFGGTGLGLAICKHLVTLMGGQIGVTSRVGEGSTFWFTLPLTPAAGTVRAPAPAPPLAARPRFRGRVLVADDNATNQRVAQLALEGLGCQVELARNGVEALSLIQRWPYDLVFMDCEMPELDGFEVTREIRELETRLAPEGTPLPHPHIPVVAMTAKVMSGDRERCLAAGMDDYLGKPVQLPALIETLARWLPVEAAPGVADAPVAHTPPPASPGLALPDAPTGALDRAALARLRTLAQAATPGLFAQVLNVFRTDAETYLVALRDAAARHDCVRLARTAHALKGASLNVGATTMADTCRQLETVEETGSVVAVPPVLAQLESEFKRVKIEIERELDQKQANEDTHR